MDSFIDIAKEVFEIEAKEILKATKNIDINFDKAVELIYKTKGKLIITGVGKSGLIGAKISATMSSTGTSSFFLHPTEAMHGDLGMVDKNDTILAISYSGESEELINILPHLKRFNVPIIAMASDKNSTLAKNCDIFLNISIENEACPLNTAPTSSTTLTLVLGDALSVALMKKRGFKKEDFASFHPGGSLGKRLFVKVSSLMQTKNLPIVSHETSIKEAIITMSEGKLGNGIIVDDNNKVLGVISDGDLRRYLLKGYIDLNNKALDIATKNPISIRDKNMLAVDALKIIEDNKIQLLLILDNDNKLVGVLHIHKLVEAGIK